MFMLTRDTFSTSFSIVVWAKSGNTLHTLNVPRDLGLRVYKCERLWRAVIVPLLRKRVNFQKARTQIRNLASFQLRKCRMERYKRQRSSFSCWYTVRLDVCLAFCVCLHLFVCLCLSAFVSGGPSVCLSISVSRPGRVCLCFSGLCLSVCLSRTPCVSCLLCLLSVPWRLLLFCVGLEPCPILSWLSCLAWFCLRVTSLRCYFVVFTLPLVLLRSFVLWLFCSFCSLFLHSSKASHVEVLSHANANKAQQLTFEKFTTAAPPVLSKEHNARTRGPQVCSGMTPANLPSDNPILRSSATPVSYSSRKLERRNDASDSPEAQQAVTSSGLQQRRAPIGGRLLLPR